MALYGRVVVEATQILIDGEKKMTNAEAIELVKGKYAAFGRGDMAALLEGVDENVEWTVPGPDTVAACGVYHGPQGVASFFSRIAETLKFDVFDPQEFIAADNQVVALGHMAGTVIATGKPFGYGWSMVFTFEGDKLVKFREYYDTANLIEASSK